MLHGNTTVLASSRPAVTGVGCQDRHRWMCTSSFCTSRKACSWKDEKRFGRPLGVCVIMCGSSSVLWSQRRNHTCKWTNEDVSWGNVCVQYIYSLTGTVDRWHRSQDLLFSSPFLCTISGSWLPKLPSLHWDIQWGILLGTEILLWTKMH